MFLEIKISIVIIASIIAAYTDFKTGYIYDWLTYSFIILGAVFAIFSENILWAFGQFAIVFALGYVFYKAGKFGGGDIKFLAGIPLFFPFYAGFPFILVVLLFASLFAILVYGIYYFILLAKNPEKEFLISTTISFIISIFFAIVFYLTGVWYFAAGIFVFCFFALQMILLKNTITEKFYKKTVAINKVLNDDLIDLNKLKKDYALQIKQNGEMFPLDNEFLLLLKKSLPKTAMITVYNNLPKFGPFIAAGVIAGFVVLSFVNLAVLL